ncbi:MAG: hypothetical protein AAGG47_12010 [Pseudomonadota bacterium]
MGIYRHISFIYRYLPAEAIYALAILGVLAGALMILFAALGNRERDFGIFLMPFLFPLLRIGMVVAAIFGVAASGIVVYPLAKRDIAEALATPPEPPQRVVGECLGERKFINNLASDHPFEELGELAALPASTRGGESLKLQLNLAENRDFMRLSCMRTQLCRIESERLCAGTIAINFPLEEPVASGTIPLPDDLESGQYRLHLVVFEAEHPTFLVPRADGDLPKSDLKRYRYIHAFEVQQ